jgi:hypothetical protein
MVNLVKIPSEKSNGTPPPPPPPLLAIAVSTYCLLAKSLGLVGKTEFVILYKSYKETLLPN